MMMIIDFKPYTVYKEQFVTVLRGHGLDIFRYNRKDMIYSYEHHIDLPYLSANGCLPFFGSIVPANVEQHVFVIQYRGKAELVST